MQRLVVIGLVMLLTLAACGAESGSSDDPDEPTNTTQAQANSDDTPPTTLTVPTPPDDDPAGETEGTGPSTATVTLNGETYQFSTEGAFVAQCLPDLFGIMSVQLPMIDADGNPADGSIQIIALQEGTDPAEVEQMNSVHVTIGDVDWVADPEDVRIADKADLAGKSQVDSVQVDGSTVMGSATFVGSQSVFDADSDMASGTFEATCGEERSS